MPSPPLLLLLLLAPVIIDSHIQAIFPFLHTFYYPRIPFSQGLHHIHTIEHLQLIPPQRTPSGYVPFFRVVSASPPAKLGRFSTVSCNCTLLGRPYQLKMLSDSGNTNHIVCLHNSSAVATIKVKASKMGKGHVVSMRCEYHHAPRRATRVFERVARFMRFFEDHLRWRNLLFENRNLTIYRRMILGSSRG